MDQVGLERRASTSILCGESDPCCCSWRDFDVQNCRLKLWQHGVAGERATALRRYFVVITPNHRSLPIVTHPLPRSLLFAAD